MQDTNSNMSFSEAYDKVKMAIQLTKLNSVNFNETFKKSLGFSLSRIFACTYNKIKY